MNFAEGFQVLLTGVDTAASSSFWREEQYWRDEDLHWRQVLKAYQQTVHDFRDERRTWRLQDMDQRLLDNIRELWKQYVERNRRDVEEHAWKLRVTCNVGTLLAGFAASTLWEFGHVVSNHPATWLFSLLTAVTVSLELLSSLICALLLDVVLKAGKHFVAEVPEAEFFHACREFAVNPAPSQKLPLPARTLTSFWARACEPKWRVAFFMFSAGLPTFFANFAMAGYFKLVVAPAPSAAGFWLLAALMMAAFLLSLYSFGRMAWEMMSEHDEEAVITRTWSHGMPDLVLSWTPVEVSGHRNT